MKTLMMLAAALLTATAVQAEDKKAAQKDEAKILGIWEMVSGEKGGEKAPEQLVKTFRLTFKAEGKLSFRAEGKDEEGTYKLDADKKIKQIDLKVGEKAVEGIYVLDKDSLKLCLGEAGTRPDELKSPQGTKLILLELRRMKK